MIELRFLEHALALRDQRSFSAAARVLHLSQPALTRSIQLLEQKVGTQLFERGRRAVLPTAAGMRFLEKAASLVASSRDLEAMFGDTVADDPGDIAVGAGPYACEMILGPVAARMLRDAPGVRLRIVLDEWMGCVERVRNRDVDLCVAETSHLGAAADLVVRQLAPHQGYFVVRAGHPLGRTRNPDLGAILACPLVSPSRLPPRVSTNVAAGLQQSGSRKLPCSSVTCDPPSLMRAIVLESDAVGLFTLPIIEQDLQRGSLQILPLVPPWLTTSFGIIRLKDRHLPAICRVAMEHIIERDRELVELETQLQRTLAMPTGPAPARASRSAPRRA